MEEPGIEHDPTGGLRNSDLSFQAVAVVVSAHSAYWSSWAQGTAQEEEAEA